MKDNNYSIVEGIIYGVPKPRFTASNMGALKKIVIRINTNNIKGFT